MTDIIRTEGFRGINWPTRFTDFGTRHESTFINALDTPQNLLLVAMISYPKKSH